LQATPAVPEAIALFGGDLALQGLAKLGLGLFDLLRYAGSRSRAQGIQWMRFPDKGRALHPLGSTSGPVGYASVTGLKNTTSVSAGFSFRA